MAELSISFDDLQNEIERLNNLNPDGFSTREMSRGVGYSVEWCREKIGDLIERGKIEYKGKRATRGIDGKIVQVPIYGLKS